MSILKSLVTGLSQVFVSPGLVLGIYLLSLVVALPLAVGMRGTLESSIGSSLVDEKLTAGFDLGWYGEYSSGARGLERTFTPAVTGILPQMRNLEQLLDGGILSVPAPVLLAGILFLLAWAFLAGGILDRYAQPMGATSSEQFFSQCGEHFFRFVRLQAVGLFFYWLIFRWVANPLHRWVLDSNRDVTQETLIMVHVFSVYALVGLLLILLSMALDYARIVMVTERWRSALLALVRGLGFTLKRFPWTFGLYFVLLAVGGVLLLVYSWIAPGPGQSNWGSLFFAFVIGQVYLLARIALKLWFLAAETDLFASQERASRF